MRERGGVNCELDKLLNSIVEQMKLCRCNRRELQGLFSSEQQYQ